MDDRFATLFSEAQPGVGGDPEPESSPARYLILLSGGIPGTMIPVTSGELDLGRSEENGVALPDPSVSRRHASIETDEGGQVWLTDQGSTNGTFRNGRRLEAFEAVRIHDGDRLRLGTRVVLKFACPDPEEEEFQRSMFERTVRDLLTGLYNRSYFLDQVRALASRSSANGLGLALLMIDIDHFKDVNDRLGHDAGDAVLRGVASLIRQATRSEDLVARYGGEEFAVALPVATAEMALARAEHLRETLAGTPLRFADCRLRVTASIGVAFQPRGESRDCEALITTADHALYRAKNSGRNRVVRSEGTSSRTMKSLTVVDY